MVSTKRNAQKALLQEPLKDKDRPKRELTIFNKSWELARWGRDCHVEVTVCIDGKYTFFRSARWTPPTASDHIQRFNVEDHMTRSQCIKVGLVTPSDTLPVPHLLPKADSKEPHSAAIISTYENFINAGSPFSDTSEESLRDYTPATPVTSPNISPRNHRLPNNSPKSESPYRDGADIPINITNLFRTANLPPKEGDASNPHGRKERSTEPSFSFGTNTPLESANPPLREGSSSSEVPNQPTKEDLTKLLESANPPPKEGTRNKVRRPLPGGTDYFTRRSRSNTNKTLPLSHTSYSSSTSPLVIAPSDEPKEGTNYLSPAQVFLLDAQSLSAARALKGGAASDISNLRKRASESDIRSYKRRKIII